MGVRYLRRSRQIFCAVCLSASILSGRFASAFHVPSASSPVGSKSTNSFDSRSTAFDRSRRRQHREDAISSSTLTSLHQQNDVDIDAESRPGTARFTGIDLSQGGGTTGALDAALSLIASDVASIALGALGLAVVVGHRLATMDDTVESLAQQTRADLLAVFACGSVLLNGITKLDVTAALSETVQLQGIELGGVEMTEIGTSESKSFVELVEWAFGALLAATPARTAVLLRRQRDDGWSVVACAGIVPKPPSSEEVPSSATPILDRVAAPSNSLETYLPTLQALPGRFELLTFLPQNAQLALLVPVGRGKDSESNDVLLIGSDTAKSFSPRNVAWARVIAERISSEL